jgi:hypothetical protein
MLPIFIDCADKRFISRTRNVRQSLEWQIIRIRANDAHFTQADPESPFLILEQGVHVVLGKTVRVSRIIPIPNKSVAVRI